MNINKAINRERKKKKEQRKKETIKITDRTEGYKNKTLNIKKRREEKVERIIYLEDVWIEPIRKDN